jgi:hypothetical protein
MITKAIKSLCPTASFSVVDEEYNKITWISENIPMPTEAEVLAEVERLKTEAITNLYKEKRLEAYPSFAEQFDTLYHGGYDAWKATIDAVKQQYPKP